MAINEEGLTARLTAIETRINEIQLVLTNLASRKQMKSIMNLRQSEIDTLKAEVEALQLQVGIGVSIADLPTTDPGVAGQLWIDILNDNVIKVSQG